MAGAAAHTLHNKQFIGGQLCLQPDIAVVRDKNLVVCLGETKLKHTLSDECVAAATEGRAAGAGGALTIHAFRNVRCVSGDRYKLACMSAAACGALQLRIQLWEAARPMRSMNAGSKCLCGTPESLFPIPLVESYRNDDGTSVLSLYYGKTLHDTDRTPLCTGCPVPPRSGTVAPSPGPVVPATVR